MTFAASARAPCLLRIGGYADAVGVGSVSISIDPTIVADGCDDALVVGEGFGLDFAPDSGRSTSRALPASPRARPGSADYDTRLAAYLFDCPNLALLGCADDSPSCPSFTSTMTVPVTGGTAVGAGTRSISLSGS